MKDLWNIWKWEWKSERVTDEESGELTEEEVIGAEKGETEIEKLVPCVVVSFQNIGNDLHP